MKNHLNFILMIDVSKLQLVDKNVSFDTEILITS